MSLIIDRVSLKSIVHPCHFELKNDFKGFYFWMKKWMGFPFYRLPEVLFVFEELICKPINEGGLFVPLFFVE